MSKDTSIPLGLCQCGCGQQTRISTRTCRRFGRIAGQPMRFVNGHSSRMLPANRYEHRGDTTALILPLADGSTVTVLIDAADAERVQSRRWLAQKTRYGWRVSSTDRDRIDLSRFILGVPNGVLVDHESRDRLDNRRTNLREASHGQNTSNSILSPRNTTGYKGVRFDPNRRPGRYQACIKVNGRLRSLGVFRSAEDAARAYDEAARVHYGEYARLNFPGPGERGAR